MQDIFQVAIIGIFFSLTMGFVLFCERLMEQTS